jgi:mannose-6-phosphate isomerase-like protein (cupin superfamily)
MILDGERFNVGPGDVTAVFPGGSHSLENTGDETMHMIVISVR